MARAAVYSIEGIEPNSNDATYRLSTCIYGSDVIGGQINTVVLATRAALDNTALFLLKITSAVQAEATNHGLTVAASNVWFHNIAVGT